MKRLILFLFLLVSCTPAWARLYTTNFPTAENPISESGLWRNGSYVGSANVQVSPAGKVHGVPTNPTPQYYDPTAILLGSWGNTQSAQATVSCTNPSSSYFQEVELHLRRNMTAGSPGLQYGYEVAWSCTGSRGNYMGLAAWGVQSGVIDGILGHYTALDGGLYNGTQYSVVTGDVVRATITGNVVTAYKNGVQQFQITVPSNIGNDSHFSSGVPGLGFNYGLQTTAVDVGFISYTTWDSVDSSGISSGAGWHDLTGTHLRSVVPCTNTGACTGTNEYCCVDRGGVAYHIGANMGPIAITAAWNGGVLDSLRNRLIIWGGGHGDYFGNELYSLNLESQPPTLTRITDPGLPPASDAQYSGAPLNNSPEALVNGTQPNSRHTYGGMAYLPNVDKMWAYGGAISVGGFGPQASRTWLFNFGANSWEDKGVPNISFGGNATSSDYDPVNRLLYILTTSQLYSYDPLTNLYTQLSHDAVGLPTHLNGAVDPVGRRYVTIGEGVAYWYSIANGSTYTRNALPVYPGGQNYPGLAWNGTNLVAWNGGDSIYILNSDLSGWVTQTYSGGPVAVTNGSGTGNTFGRWRWSSNTSAFVTYNLIDSDGYVLRTSAVVADTTAPSVPTNLTATAVSSSQINLSWTASTDNVGVTGYFVYRGGTQIGSTTSASYSDTTLAPSTSYTYIVAAYDAASNLSAQSGSASATTQAGGGGGGVLKRINFTAASETTTPTVTCTGDVYTNDNGGTAAGGALYSVGRGYGWASTPATRVRGANANPCLDSFAFTGAALVTWKYDLPNGNYYISAASGDPTNSRAGQKVIAEGSTTIISATSVPSGTFVTAVDIPVTVADGQLTITIGGTGGEDTCLNYIVVKSATGGGGDTTAPSTPTNLTASTVSSSQLGLTWTASTDNVAVTGYNIIRNGSQVATSATNSYTDSGLTPSTSYTYAVSAFDAAGNISAQSTSASATTAGGASGSSSTFILSSATTGTNLPFTLGLVFKSGDIPGFPILDKSQAQVVVKRRWNNGSVKHAIASGHLTFSGAPITVTFSNSPTAPSGTNLTSADIVTANPSASIQLGSIGTVTLSSLLATPFRTWISGPEMVECHYRSYVGSDTALNVWFHVRLYKQGRIWIRAVIENGFVGVKVDKSYIPTVIIGGVTVYDNGGATLNHWRNTRWTAEGWIGGNPQITPKHNSQYLIDTKLFPNYWKRSPAASVFTSLNQTYVPMTSGDHDPGMGSAGFQSAIGLIPLWDALYVTSGDSRAWNSMLTNSSSINTYSICWRDQTTQLYVKPSSNPTPLNAYAYSNGGGFIWDFAHHPSEGYSAYLLSGDYWHYETMQMNAGMGFMLLNTVGGRGIGLNCILTGETRGTAWELRSLSQLAGVYPTGDVVAAEYQTLLGNNVAHWKVKVDSLTGQGTGRLYAYGFGDCPTLTIDTNPASSTYGMATNCLIGDFGLGVISPWQDHFWAQSMGMGSDVEPFADMTVYNTVRDSIYKAPVGILQDQTGFWFNYASNYDMKIYPQLKNGQPYVASSSNPIDWCMNSACLWNSTIGGNPNLTTTPVGPYPKPANNASGVYISNPVYDNILKGISGGAPSCAVTGYWGNLMPAIAYAVDHNATGAAAAWARFTGATNFYGPPGSLTIEGGNCSGAYGFNEIPNWGIVPRQAVAPPTLPPPPTNVRRTPN